MSQPASPVPVCKPRKTSTAPDFSSAFCYIRVVLLLYFSKLLYTEIFLVPSGELSWQNWGFCFAHFPWRCCTLSVLLLHKGNEFHNYFLSRVLRLMFTPKIYCPFRSKDNIEREAIFFWHLIGKVIVFSDTCCTVDTPSSSTSEVLVVSGKFYSLSFRVHIFITC